MTAIRSLAETSGTWLLAGSLLLFSRGAAGGANFPPAWHWSNPKPHGANVVDLALSPLFGLALQVAELGQIFSSSDLDFWIARDSGTTNDLRAVAFFGSRILVTGASGTVLYADSVDDFKPGVLASGATADWLEAVAVAPFLAVAVGDNGAVYSSTNGIYWTRRNSNTSQWLRGVAFGNGVFVAVGENGKIISSATGTNGWTGRTSNTSEHLNGVSFANNRFTAVAESGVCLFSTNNGVNWHPEVTGATNDLFDTISAPDARLVIGDNEVRSQQAGGPWLNELARTNGPTAWTYYANAKPPDFFLIAGRTGLMEEGHPSTNSNWLFWLPGDLSVRTWLWDVVCPTNFYVAVGDRATVMTSGNGVDWRLELVPDALTNAIFFGVGGTTNLLVAVGNAGSLMISPNVATNTATLIGTNTVLTNASAFGVIWYPMNSQTTNDLQGVGASANLFVTTGDSGTILTSPDGTNWTLCASPTNRFLSSVTPWPGGWVATGDDGAIVTSVDGVKWDLVPPPTTNWLYRVRYAGAKLITVGQNGTILTSANGSTWTKQTSGTTKWLNDVAFVGDTWFVVGNSGTVLTSTNTVTWTSAGTLTRKNLYGAATDSRQLVTVGIEGVILRSQIVPDTTPITILSYDRVMTNTVFGPVAENIYLFGGKVDQQFTLDRSTLATNAPWVSGPHLEFLDGSGTLFYLETITSSNALDAEFYRATLIVP